MNSTNTPQQARFPWLWVILTVSVIAGLIWYIFQLKAESKIQDKIEQKIEIQKQADSLTTKRDDQIHSVITNSQTNAVRANNLIKTLPNEEIIIRDTTYAAMCKYITDYRPE